MIRTYVRVTVELESPWHVGAPLTDDPSTVAVARNMVNGSDKADIARSLTGSLRQSLGDEAELLMGTPYGTRIGEEKEAQRSLWWVLGGTFLNNTGGNPHSSQEGGPRLIQVEKLPQRYSILNRFLRGTVTTCICGVKKNKKPLPR